VNKKVTPAETAQLAFSMLDLDKDGKIQRQDIAEPDNNTLTLAPLDQVRKTPSWPRSWANFSLL
jgi:hypothetical protein